MIIAVKLTPWVLIDLERSDSYMAVKVECTMCGSQELHCIELPAGPYTPLRPDYSIEGRILEGQISRRHLHPEYRSLKHPNTKTVNGWGVYERSNLELLERTLDEEISQLKDITWPVRPKSG
jgi:hypothetical protein